MCSKHSHRDKKAARLHVVSANKQAGEKIYQAYRCRKCGFWHVGRPTPLMQLAEAARRSERRDDVLVGKLIQALKDTVFKENVMSNEYNTGI